MICSSVNRFRFICPSFNRGRTLTPGGGKTQWQVTFVLVADTAINFLMFAPPYIITQGGPAGTTHLLMYEAYQSAFTYFDHGRAMAISVVVLLMILLIVAVELRLFRPKEAK
jgi:multiple sugar transport system permease protein